VRRWGKRTWNSEGLIVSVDDVDGGMMTGLHGCQPVGMRCKGARVMWHREKMWRQRRCDWSRGT
jgi:hypothetical protein